MIQPLITHVRRLFPADPLLTPLGIEQAKDIHAVWKKEALVGLPAPHKRYCSPLSRALDTCDMMLDQVFSTHAHPVLILEVSLPATSASIAQ